jgi:hypothetical protein
MGLETLIETFIKHSLVDAFIFYFIFFINEKHQNPFEKHQNFS